LPELLTTGKSFSLSGEAKVNTGTIGIRLNNETPTVSMVITSTTYVPFEAVTAYDGTGTLSLDFTSMGAGETISVKNLSIKLVQVFTLEGNASIFQPPVDASGPFGYLAEKASTNLVVQSEAIGTWIGIGGVDGQTNSLTGASNASLLTETNTSAPQRNYKVVTGTTNCTLSCYAKAGTRNFVTLSGVVGGSDFAAAAFDLSAGTAQTAQENGTVTGQSNIESVGGGWYRCSLSLQSSSGAINQIKVGLSNTATPTFGGWGDYVYTGNGLTAYFFGAQLEAGTYPTSYIPTTTTAVLRNADVLTAGDMVTDAAGSAYTEVSSIWPTAPSGSVAYALSRNGGGIMYALTSLRITSGGSYSPIGATFYNRLAPVASTWGTASGTVTAYKDGLPDLTPAAYGGTFGTGNLSIGSNHVGAYQWDGTVREVKIFDSELTAEEVGDL